MSFELKKTSFVVVIINLAPIDLTSNNFTNKYKNNNENKKNQKQQQDEKKGWRWNENKNNRWNIYRKKYIGTRNLCNEHFPTFPFQTEALFLFV
jgi:hypothetical protein